MNRNRLAWTLGAALLCCALVRCGAGMVPSEAMDGGDEGDGDPSDAGPLPDAGATDAGGVDDSDAGATDAGGVDDSDAGSSGSPDAGGPDGGADGGPGLAGIRAGDELKATADLNLRTGPGSTNPVTLVIPRTGVGKALLDQSGGWVKLTYAAREGYASAKFLTVMPTGSGADPGSTWVARGALAVGYSYFWGHGAYSTDSAAPHGSCAGTCPGCTHSGSFGADCSGMVAKAWLVPASNSSLSADSHPYSTYHFYNETTHWKPVNRAEAMRGDALVYRIGSSGHVFLYESGDPWGSIMAVECKGCAAGCVRDLRTASTDYKAIRRDAAVLTERPGADEPAQ